MTITWLALLLAQDQGWDKPTEVERIRMAIPWVIDAANDRFITIQGGDERTFQSVVRTLAGKKICEASLTTFEGPPAMLIRKDTLHALYIGDGRKVQYRTMDLKTGAATEATEVKIDGLERAEDDIWPMLVEHGDAWYYTVSENGGKRLFVARSTDEGKTWTVVSPEAWSAKRADGSRPLLVSLGKDLHLFFGTADGLTHVSTSDGGKTWADRGTKLDGKPVPMTIGSDGDRACLVYTDLSGSKSEFALRALTTSDAGKTWKKGGEIVTTGLDDPSAMAHVSISGDRIAFFGLGARRDERGNMGMRGLAFLSADGGATWRDLEAERGMARTNIFYCGSFVPGGAELVVAFLNVESGDIFDWPTDSYLLLRRYGKREPPAALTDAERAQVREWVEQLGDDDLEVQEQAEVGIAKLGDRAVPFLRELAAAMKDEQRRARIDAIVKKMLPAWWKG